MQYPDMFKNAMTQKMTGPDAISATARIIVSEFPGPISVYP